VGLYSEPFCSLSDHRAQVHAIHVQTSISEVHGAPILQGVLNGADRIPADYKYYS